jgi:hypothetical protein
MRVFIEFEDKLYERVEKEEKNWGCNGTCDFRDSPEDEKYKDGCQRFQDTIICCSDLRNQLLRKGHEKHFGWKEVKG